LTTILPAKLSVISIPETEAIVDRLVNDLWDDFLVDDVFNLQDLERVRKKSTVSARLDEHSNDEVMAAIATRRTRQSVTRHYCERGRI
jgi:hypothetical protein